MQQDNEPCDCESSETDNPHSDLASVCQTKASGISKDFEPPYAVVQVEVSRSVFNLLSSSESPPPSSSTSHDVTDETSTSTLDSVSCDCTTEKSYETSTVSKSSVETIESSNEFERTLAIIKPEAMIFRKEIEQMILDAGFHICQLRWVRLTPEQVSDFYLDKFKEKFFPHLITYMSSGPILVYVIGKVNAIQEWRELMGPKKVTDARDCVPDSIRGRFGRKDDDIVNVVHGSRDRQSAEREIGFFFPDQFPEQMPKDESAVDYLWKYVNPTLSEALIKCCEEKPDDPITWLGNWLLDNNKPKYLYA